VENSRKTIVVTLKREASTDLELPKSPNDVRRFREKFEGLMKRFGEVSGSHSKILNNFMKKNAARMKEEFESLEELLAQAKLAISEYDQSRAPLIKCSAVLNTLTQKAGSIRTGESELASAQIEADLTQRELADTKAELETLKSSAEYDAAQAVAQELSQAEHQRKELHNKVSELFSHASRAFTKYSYGVSKETESRLNTMASEPWQLLYLQDTSPYTALLLEVKKSISSGKIQLKDSEKTIHYIDLITQYLADFQAKASQLEVQVKALKERDVSSFSRVGQLEKKAADLEDRMSRSKGNAELLRRQNEEKRAEIDALRKEVADSLSSISGRKYSVSS
jgi:chromosome segregation ATPase